MKVKINVYGFLRYSVPDHFSQGSAAVEIKDATSVFELLTDCLGIDTPNTTVLVNEMIQNSDYRLRDGDFVQVISPIPDG